MDEKAKATAEAEGKARAMKLLGPVFDLWREGLEEERRKGMSEAELQSRIKQVCAMVEEQSRGKVPDEMLGEMLNIILECAMPAEPAPGGLN